MAVVDLGDVAAAAARRPAARPAAWSGRGSPTSTVRLPQDRTLTGDQLPAVGALPRLVAVERSGRWYLSPLGTLLGPDVAGGSLAERRGRRARSRPPTRVRRSRPPCGRCSTAACATDVSGLAGHPRRFRGRRPAALGLRGRHHRPGPVARPGDRAADGRRTGRRRPGRGARRAADGRRRLRRRPGGAVRDRVRGRAAACAPRATATRRDRLPRRARAARPRRGVHADRRPRAATAGSPASPRASPTRSSATPTG